MSIRVYFFLEYGYLKELSFYGKLTSVEPLMSPCWMKDIYTLTVFTHAKMLFIFITMKHFPFRISLSLY